MTTSEKSLNEMVKEIQDYLKTQQASLQLSRAKRFCNYLPWENEYQTPQSRLALISNSSYHGRNPQL